MYHTKPSREEIRKSITLCTEHFCQMTTLQNLRRLRTGTPCAHVRRRCPRPRPIDRAEATKRRIEKWIYIRSTDDDGEDDYDDRATQPRGGRKEGEGSSGEDRGPGTNVEVSRLPIYGIHMPRIQKTFLVEEVQFVPWQGI